MIHQKHGEAGGEMNDRFLLFLFFFLFLFFLASSHSRKLMGLIYGLS